MPGAGVRCPAALGALVRDRHLLDDLDAKALERRHPPGMVGEQPDTAEVEIGEDLGSQPDLALRSPLMLGLAGFAPLVREGQLIALRQLAHAESLRRLMQVDQRAPSG